jgi:membrane fusion protein, multidrug efflux system
MLPARPISFAAFGLILSLAACGKKAAPSPVPPVVSVAQPVSREIIEWDEYIGRLESPETVEIRARVSGYLNKVHFKEGKEVKKGDLLFTIDPRPYQAEFERADGDYHRALNQAELAKNDAERGSKLAGARVISAEELDTKTKNYSAALAAAKAAKGTADLAKLNLEFCQIRAPIDGRISRALVTEGNLVAGGVQGTTLLTTIVSLDPLYLYGDADERAILKYNRLAREGARASARDQQIPAEMELADETNFPHKGYMDFVENRIDPSTGTLRARGVFRNEDRRLSPGFFARIRIPGSGTYRTLLVPDRALGADQAQKFVYVVNAEKKVEFRPVKVGGMSDGLRIVSSGLKGDEQIIVEGQIRVRPGVIVDPRPPKEAL